MVKRGVDGCRFVRALRPEANHAMKLLFVCSRNQWRSRTAEVIFRDLPGHVVKSAGTEPSARIRLTEKLVRWADIIFVMERKHGAIIRERFPEAVEGRAIHCLDIQDDFEFMEPELIASLQSAVSLYLHDRGG